MNLCRSTLTALIAAAALRCSGRAADPGGASGTCRADGACLLLAPAGADSAQNPCYSPDNSKLLITLWHGGYNLPPAGLFSTPAAGGPATAVIDGTGTNVNVNLPGTCWNGATGRITFASDRDGANEEIYTARPDGGDLFRVTRHDGAAYIEPSFSPDGSELVFEVSPGNASGEIWKVSASGAGGPTLLTSGAFDKQPNWSPTGSAILFQRFANDRWSIYTMNTDGTGLTRVTPAQDSSTDASWSPRGDRIVYSGSPGGAAGANIFVAAAAGNAPPSRVTSQPGYDGAVTWSPDGRWLAFESSANPNGTAPSSIWRIPAPQ